MTNIILTLCFIGCFGTLRGSNLVLSDFHVYSVPTDDLQPIAASRSFHLDVDNRTWATLRLSRRQVITVTTEGAIFFALFRKGGPIFPPAIDWFQGKLHGGPVNRPIKVDPYDQVLLIVDDSGKDLAVTLKALNRLVAAQCCPQFNLSLCLEDLLTSYPELKRIGFLFASVMPRDEAVETFCIFSLDKSQSFASSSPSRSFSESVWTESESRSWSYDSRSRLSDSISSSEKSCEIRNRYYQSIYRAKAPSRTASDLLAWESFLLPCPDPLTVSEFELENVIDKPRKNRKKSYGTCMIC